MQVVRDLAEAHIHIDDIGLHRPTLDDVFLTLTGHVAEEAQDDDAKSAAGRRASSEGGMTTARLAPQARRSGLSLALRDGLIVMWRNLKRIPRIPELAIFAILQSIMFVLLFSFVFGGAIPLPGGGNFKEFLMPGIFVQTLAFASATTSIGMADDMGKGIIDRFRSLPMARSAVLTGRTFSDVIYNLGILVVLMLSGLVVGWTVRTGIVELLEGIALLLLFAFAMSWIGVWLGLSVPTVEVAQQVGFIAIFPITFVSNVFVPTSHAARLAAAVCRVEPGEHAHRHDPAAVGQPQPVRRARHPAGAINRLLLTLGWIVLILAVFIPLGVRRYRLTSR